MKKILSAGSCMVLAFALILTAAGVSSFPNSVFAVVQNPVVITTATGGTNIPADKAANAGSPAYTTLGDIVIAEVTGGKGAFADTGTPGVTKTFILSAPSGWTFQANAGSVSFAPGKDIVSASSTVSGSFVTITMEVQGTNSSDTLTISGLRVQATNGGSLPSSGDILRTSSNSGTETIVGITNDVTSLGALSQMAGTATQVKVETVANGSGTAVPAQNLTVGNALPVYGVTRDQFGNYVGNPADTAWSLTGKTGGVVDADLTGSPGSSAVLTGNLTGSATIHAANNSLTAGDSGTISVVFAGQADLDTAILAAGALTEAEYTVASWADLSAALALPATTNAEVVAKTTAINGAIASLVLVADMTGYDDALAAVDEADYTATSWSTYQVVVLANVRTNQDTQVTVDTSTGLITAAQGSLVLKADLTSYTAALAAVTEADYTVASWTTYQGVVAANVVTTENTQGEADAATAAITTAQGSLVADTVPPVISSQTTANPAETSLTATWTTDRAATSRVIYDTVSQAVLGAAPNYGYASSTGEDVTPVTSHSVTVPGLLSGTTYFFRTISRGSPEAVSDEFSGTTSHLSSPAPSPAPAPVPGGGGSNSGGGGSGAGFNAIPKPSSLSTPSFLPTPQVLGAAAFRFTITLQLGSRGDDVTELQKRLTAEGVYSGPITGYFGPLTFGAVKKYQEKNGIDAIGIVGPVTRAKFNSSLAAAPAAGTVLGANTNAHAEAIQAQIATLQTQLVAILQQLAAMLQARRR